MAHDIGDIVECLRELERSAPPDAPRVRAWSGKGAREIERLRVVNADLLDAHHTMLNLSGAARAGALTKAWKGLDVNYHVDKARAAIFKAERPI